MANRRKYTDQQLVHAVESAQTWADVLEAIGKRRGGSAKDVQKVAVALGLDTSHFEYRRSRTPLTAELPFGRPAAPDFRSSMVIAARWFLDRQYITSVPLEVAPYDFVVESDEGLKRVQVKSSRRTTATGSPTVSINRQTYDVMGTVSSRGRVRRTTYTADEIDLFFIVTPTALYLIPLPAVLGLKQLVLEPKYQNFRVA